MLKARNGGRQLQNLSAEKRSQIIIDYGEMLLANVKEITQANELDIETAKKQSKTKIRLYHFM